MLEESSAWFLENRIEIAKERCWETAQFLIFLGAIFTLLGLCFYPSDVIINGVRTLLVVLMFLSFVAFLKSNMILKFNKKI